MWYLFEGHSIEVVCDETERIVTIFVRRDDGESLCEIPFSIGRGELEERYGPPSRSGAPGSITAGVPHGAWDRYDLPTVSIHVEYRRDSEQIEVITLMHPDAARAVDASDT